MHTKVFKLELFLVLSVLLLNISCSFAGPIVYKPPTSIGNYEYPYGVYIPSNFIIPDGNVFKFTLYLAGFVWFTCNGTSGEWSRDQFRSVYFNSKKEISFFPYSAVAELDFFRDNTMRSSIPKYDTSTLSFTCIDSAPSYNPKKDVWDEFCVIKRTTGDGAFSDITYLILTEAKNGAAPPNEKCGTNYPDGYIYSNAFTATILFCHNETQ
ncbi:putative exported protein [Gigaspora margarita]|uniref:Putative exported protein n=1 Tax=Gigaspora margarita TaxID=4874 RepID=A0A8H4AQH0_GIGMA|nr:putative exported protein [Gigaspora margarita]